MRPTVRRVAIFALLALCASAMVWMFNGPDAGDGLVGNSNVVGGIAGVIALGLAALAHFRPSMPALSFGPSEDQMSAATDHLAQVSLSTWRAEAKDRRVTTPAPATVAWRWAGPDLAAPSEEVANAPLLTGGVITRLRCELYESLPHPGRVIVLGGPGAGKTTALMLLLIDVLTHRDARSAEPVPVLLTLGGWDPGSPLLTWAATVINRDYRELTSYAGPNAAAELIRVGKVALFLDGLDEMPDDLRGSALKAIDEAATGIRVVLTSRYDEFRAAADRHRLWDAAVVELLPVDLDNACEFLLHQQVGRLRQSWQEVTERMSADPEGTAAQTLRNPLALSLARDAYSVQQTNPVDLLAFNDPDALVRHLLTRLLTQAYPDADSKADAVRWLTWMAENLDGNRDIRWWEISTWAANTFPPPVRSLTAAGTGMIVLAGTAGTVVAGGGIGLIIGIFVFNLLMVLGFVGASFLPDRTILEPQALIVRRPSREEIRDIAVSALRSAFAFGLLMTILTGLFAWIVGAFVIAFGADRGPLLRPWIAVSLAAFFCAALTDGLNELLNIWNKPVPADRAVSPLELYRTDRRRAVAVGIGIGLVAAIVSALVSGILTMIAVQVLSDTSSGFAPGLFVGGFIGVAVGTTFGRGASAGPARNLVLAELAARVRGRPVDFIDLLESARKRNIIRQSGAIYQFRHAALQDLLANVHPVPADSAATPDGRTK